MPNELDAYTRKAFEDTILTDPLDLTTRKVYADWLEDHGEHELAHFHRTMTVEKYTTAKKWMEAFAANANEYEEEGGTQRTFHECMEAAEKYFEHGVPTVVGVMGFGASEQLVTKEDYEEFWDAYSVLSSTLMPERNSGDPFMCGC